MKYVCFYTVPFCDFVLPDGENFAGVLSCEADGCCSCGVDFDDGVRRPCEASVVGENKEGVISCDLEGGSVLGEALGDGVRSPRDASGSDIDGGVVIPVLSKCDIVSSNYLYRATALTL